jgi:hypothetical protein
MTSAYLPCRFAVILRCVLGAVTAAVLAAGCGTEGAAAGPAASDASAAPSAGASASPSVTAAAMTEGAPPQAVLTRYHLPAPRGLKSVKYLEEKAWSGGDFYLEAAGSAVAVDAYLKDLGSSRSRLTKGYVPITDEDQSDVGWFLGTSGSAAGDTVTLSPGPEGMTCALMVTSDGGEQHVYLMASHA